MTTRDHTEHGHAERTERTERIGRIERVLAGEGFRLTGFAGLPTLNRPTAQHQYLFVNGRPVRDKLLLGAVRAAYSDYLPRERHPVLALFVSLDPREVDVNVHPAKTEVRFRDARAVHQFVFHAVARALGRGLLAMKVSKQDTVAMLLPNCAEFVFTWYACCVVGAIMVPIMAVLFGIPSVVAKGTSLAVIIPTALMGTLRNRSNANVDLTAAVVVGITGVVMAVVGAWVSARMSDAVSNALFAVLLIAVAARMLRQAWKETAKAGG